MNFVLQFLDLNKRFILLEKIFKKMHRGSALILSEKINFLDDENNLKNNSYENLYYSFKKMNGYSDNEILNKKSALKNILITDSKNKHISID